MTEATDLEGSPRRRGRVGWDRQGRRRLRLGRRCDDETNFEAVMTSTEKDEVVGDVEMTL